MEKATFRLPEWQMSRLRQQSEQQHRSLNEVVIEVVAKGLGEPPHEHEVMRALGPMVARPALAPYQEQVSGDDSARPNLTDALDWARGDR